MNDVLWRYRALAKHCAQMLEAARRDDRHAVETLGRETQRLIAALREQSPQPLDPSSRREKFRLLREIVLIDAQIRNLSQPWTRRIDRMLSNPADGLNGVR